MPDWEDSCTAKAAMSLVIQDKPEPKFSMLTCHTEACANYSLTSFYRVTYGDRFVNDPRGSGSMTLSVDKMKRALIKNKTRASFGLPDFV